MNVRDRLYSAPVTVFSRHTLTDGQQNVLYKRFNGLCLFRYDSRTFEDYEALAEAVGACEGNCVVVAPAHWLAMLACDLLDFTVLYKAAPRFDKMNPDYDTWHAVRFYSGLYDTYEA